MLPAERIHFNAQERGVAPTFVELEFSAVVIGAGSLPGEAE
jgi:hypothetical protein